VTDTPARLLTLLSLLQTPREWPGSELARRLGVSLRTVRRDVDRLRDLGYPVEASMGALGGYRLVAGTAMPPLLLDDDEAVAIAVGLRTAAGQAVAGIDEAAVRALAKLEQVLPSRLRYRVGALGAATVPAPDAYATPVDPAHLTAIAAAIANRERVRLRYTAADGTGSRRHVEPHRLVAAGRRWYLVAYDLDRDGWRIFRADRIDAPQPTGARVTPRELPAPDAAAYVTEKMYSLVPVHSAVATLHAPIEQIRGRIGDGPGDLEPIDAGRCRLRSHTDTLEWLAFALLRLGCEFEVHEPPELREHLRLLAGRLTRAAG
jgi:predicted DNA-binding transcriptional regulator YafY